MINLLIPKIFFSLLFLLSLSLSGQLYSQEPNTAQDPVLENYKEMESAQMPALGGMMIDASYPLTLEVYELIDEYQDEFVVLRYGIQFYYDTWQVGYSNKEYGNLFNITARFLGRDAYSGLYFEFGQSFDLPRTDGRIESGMIYGIGNAGQLGYGPDAKLSSIWDVSSGVFIVDDLSYLYINVLLGGGYRIPISSTAAYVHLILRLNFNPQDERYFQSPNAEIETDFVGILYSIGLKVSYAINFNM